MKKIILIIFMVSGALFSQPTLQWATHYSFASTAYSDIPYVMAIDNSGNLYMAGRVSYPAIDWAVLKVNSSGNVAWARTYNHAVYTDDPRKIAVDLWGNLIVCGQAQSHTSWLPFVIKWDAAGNIVFRDSIKSAYSSSASSDIAADVACDAAGNVYVCGNYYRADGSSYDIFVRKYSPSGSVIYTTVIAEPVINVSSHEYSYTMYVDAAGNVYHSGTTNAYFRGYDWITTKLTPGGSVQWQKVVTSAGARSDDPKKIIVNEANGNVHVLGQIRDAFNYMDITTVTYSANGDSLWSKTEAISGTNDTPMDIKMDNAGNVYILGVTSGLYTIKYSPSGSTLWQTQSFQGQIGYGMGTGAYWGGLYVKGDGTSYLTISRGFPVGQGGPGYAKINSNGVPQWTTTYRRGTDPEAPVGVAVNSAGDIYSGIWTDGGSTGMDFTAIKFSETNSSIYEFPRNNLNKPITDNQNTFDTINVNIPGDIPAQNISDVNIRIDTVLHTNDSDLEFYLIHNNITDTLIYQAGGSGDNFIGTILDDQASTLIANGSAPFTGLFKPSKPLSVFNGGNANGNWILKVYDRASGNTGTLKAWTLTVTTQQTSGVQNIGGKIPKQFSLSQNYPNPFNPMTNVRFQMPKSGFVKLVIFDVLGREVETLVNEQLKTGTYEVDWNASEFPSGVYFYRLEADGYTDAKKMILVK